LELEDWWSGFWSFGELGEVPEWDWWEVAKEEEEEEEDVWERNLGESEMTILGLEGEQNEDEDEDEDEDELVDEVELGRCNWDEAWLVGEWVLELEVKIADEDEVLLDFEEFEEDVEEVEAKQLVPDFGV
jgi:hypothetical protein